MADLNGRTFLITGANTGIGRATTQALAARGATVYMACRSEAKARPVRDAISTATGNDNLHLHRARPRRPRVGARRCASVP